MDPECQSYQDIQETDEDQDEDYDAYDAGDGFGGISIPGYVAQAAKQISRLKMCVLTRNFHFVLLHPHLTL